jgi:flagellar biosynthesis protein FliR
MLGSAQRPAAVSAGVGTAALVWLATGQLWIGIVAGVVATLVATHVEESLLAGPRQLLEH